MGARISIRPERVALFGGSFDPPHRGHLAIARAAANFFRLDRVLFTPTGLQPLKPRGAMATYTDRLAMVELVSALDTRFSASAVDAPRPDGRPNYTVHTLEALREQYPEAQMFAIAGADSFLDLPRWYEAHRLLEMAEWIAVSRPGFPVALNSISGFLGTERSRVHVLETVHENISATELRKRLAAGEDCSESVPGSVLAYVKAHRLYR